MVFMKKIVILISAAVLIISLSSCECPSKLFGTSKDATRGVASVNEQFEQRLQDEDIYVERIRDGMLYLQQQAKKDGKLLRGTHAKGVCVKANFTISDLADLPEDVARRLKKGIFSAPGKYAAQVRFANADGKILSDQDPDVRAVSFSVKMPSALSNPQEKMDFSMNDATTFPINDAKVFSDLMVVAKEGPVKAVFTIGISGLLGVKKAVGLGDLQKHPATTAYQKLRYWSTVPFALGKEEAVKYSMKPCADNKANALTSDPDTLSKELVRHIKEDEPGCFEFQVQLLDADRMKDANGSLLSAQTWVENATLEWPEDQAPFYTVGRLDLSKNSEVPQAECEAWRIDVNGNSNETHRGLGSINRARSVAEKASAEARNKK